MDAPPDRTDGQAPGAGASGAHVFISHHSSQHEAARKLKAALAEAGVFGWMAPDDVDPGSAFDTQILDEIRRAGLVVLLLCEQSDKSRHVKREIMLAEDAGKTVIPVRMARLQSEGLAYWLKDSQWIDWFDARDDGLDRLVAAICEQLGEAPPPSLETAKVARARKRRMLAIAGVVAGLAFLGAGAWYVWARVTEPAPITRPGLWLNKREMLGITYPGNLPPETVEQIRLMMETDPNPEECLTDEILRHPDVRLFDPGNKGHCTLGAFDVGDGVMSGYLNCPIQGVKGANLAIAFRGTYTDTTIVLDQDVTMSQPDGALRFKARESSRWLAAECRKGMRQD